MPFQRDDDRVLTLLQVEPLNAVLDLPANVAGHRDIVDADRHDRQVVHRQQTIGGVHGIAANLNAELRRADHRRANRLDRYGDGHTDCAESLAQRCRETRTEITMFGSVPTLTEVGGNTPGQNNVLWTG